MRSEKLRSSGEVTTLMVLKENVFPKLLLSREVPDERGEGQEHAEGKGHKANASWSCGGPAGHQLQELLGFFIRRPEQDRKRTQPTTLLI